MNRLGDILRKALHTTPPALGFRPTAPTKPHMVLIAALNEAPSEAGAWIQGAEAVIFSANIKPRELKSLGKTLSVPYGLWLDNSTSHPTETTGVDFVSFEPDKADLGLLTNDRLGKIIAIESSWENALLHSLSELPVEAIYLKRTPQNTITWLELMQCRRLADLIAKPLLVPVASDTPAGQLKTLWEAGVDGVVAIAAADSTLKGLRQEMDELRLPTRRKWLRARPLVPMIASSPSLTQREEDEDEEEEE